MGPFIAPIPLNYIPSQLICGVCRVKTCTYRGDSAADGQLAEFVFLILKHVTVGRNGHDSSHTLEAKHEGEGRMGQGPRALALLLVRPVHASILDLVQYDRVGKCIVDEMEN